MKLVTAVVKPFKLDEVKVAVKEVGVTGLTVSQVKGFGHTGGHVEVFRGKEYVFPREDCVLLPIENTTAELIATYLGGRLLEILQREHNYRPTVLRIEIEESFGQSAFYEWSA